MERWRENDGKYVIKVAGDNGMVEVLIFWIFGEGKCVWWSMGLDGFAAKGGKGGE